MISDRAYRAMRVQLRASVTRVRATRRRAEEARGNEERAKRGHLREFPKTRAGSEPARRRTRQNPVLCVCVCRYTARHS